MSWLRSAISKAAEVGNKTNLSRTAKTFADAVLQQAAGGAKIVQDRLSGRNLNSFKNAVRRLDEVALNARKLERVQALARWLAALQDIQRTLNGGKAGAGTESPRAPQDDDSASPRRASSIYFLDPDTGSGEPLNFRDVFLHSQALENIVTSMILEAPVEEEVTMLLEMFGLCLAGGQELHQAIISSIQDLSKSCSTYVEEVMIKKEDLLQLARDAITGLKISLEVERLDFEIGNLQQQIAEKHKVLEASGDTTSNLEEILQLSAHLRNCFQKKTELIHLGDTKEGRALKVEMLKGLTTRLASTAADMEKEVVDNRQQKQEAMDYRFTKAQEVTEIEKALATDIHALTKRKDELEAELNEVKGLLAAATSRHINIQEEKEQFDEASSNIVAQLSIREDELVRSIAARKVEANAVGTWLSFLEDTWLLQSSCGQEKDVQTQVAYDDSKKQYLQLAVSSLSYWEVELSQLLKQMKFCADELEALQHKQENMQELGMGGVAADIVSAKHKIQDTYLKAESQVGYPYYIYTSMRTYFLSGLVETDETTLKLAGTFESIDKLQTEFEGRQRPVWETEHHGPKIVERGLSFVRDALAPPSTTSNQQLKKYDLPTEGRIANLAATHEDTGEAVLAKGDVTSTSPPEEKEGWELDELDEELSKKDTGEVPQ
ncbi:unnamed protein product [Sphagnum jensenii]|uniref:Uncharacterized protein n=1 Tax=Sphagnum jensenii TaxID=128206 RepID=A0ABP1B104_9BRYO